MGGETVDYKFKLDDLDSLLDFLESAYEYEIFMNESVISVLKSLQNLYSDKIMECK